MNKISHLTISINIYLRKTPSKRGFCYVQYIALVRARRDNP
jgi:hypothetical protein